MPYYSLLEMKKQSQIKILSDIIGKQKIVGMIPSESAYASILKENQFECIIIEEANENKGK